MEGDIEDLGRWEGGRDGGREGEGGERGGRKAEVVVVVED